MTCRNFIGITAAVVGIGASVSGATPALDDAMKKATEDYRERVVRAADELNRTRARIAAEKAPWLAQMRAAEDRIIAAESEMTRLDLSHEDTAAQRRKLLQEIESIRKTTGYASSLAHDGLKAAGDSLAPGEDQLFGERLQALSKKLDELEAGASGRAALDVADFLIERTEMALGGYRAEGKAILAETNDLATGTFAFVGPEAYFHPAQNAAPGTLRVREGARYPVSSPLPAWQRDEAARFFAGEPGTMMADPSGGKAFRLRETTGTVWEHVRKGGVVALAIVAVGLLAALMIIQKIRDLTAMGIESSEKVARFLELIARGSERAEQELNKLKPTTREVFAEGLRCTGQPKVIVEERLQAVLLEQRLHFERRLPLLAVIATAAPLMGLLGTVVGMVKTFALITVFGTGNAGRLASGISEVLVATELGLMVAIPTLVAHGFLAHRIQKNLAVVERQGLQFTTALETARVRSGGEPQAEPVPA